MSKIENPMRFQNVAHAVWHALYIVGYRASPPVDLVWPADSEGIFVNTMKIARIVPRRGAK